MCRNNRNTGLTMRLQIASIISLFILFLSTSAQADLLGESLKNAVDMGAKFKDGYQKSDGHTGDKLIEGMIESVTPEADEQTRETQRNAVKFMLDPNESRSEQHYDRMIDSIKDNSGNQQRGSQQNRSFNIQESLEKICPEDGEVFSSSFHYCPKHGRKLITKTLSREHGQYFEINRVEPVAYYPFMSNTNDATGNGRNGYANGATSSLGRNKRKNGSFYFDGKDDYIKLNNTESFNPRALSIGLWIKTTDNNAVLVDKRDSVSDGFTLAIVESYLHLRVNGVLVTASRTQLDDNRWHYLRATYNGNTIDLYVDDQLEHSESVSQTQTLSTRSPVS